MMQRMVADVDAAFGKVVNGSGIRYFQWKADSLEYMLSACLNDSPTETIEVPVAGKQVKYKHKSSVIVLGDCID
eukprot:4458249-Karenia_brevis.AAC.1